MSLTFFLKQNFNKLPIGPRAGKFIGAIPYSLRPGLAQSYSKANNNIKKYSLLNQTQKQDFIFKKTKVLVDHAYSKVKFYKSYYDTNGFHPEMLKNFADIEKIPIIDKSVLLKYSLEDRSITNTKGLSKANTGGSSGKPLTFYTTPAAIGHEWAHIHSFWGFLGYNPKKIMLGFGGRSNVKNIVDYDLLRNKFIVDLYADYDEVKQKLIPILRSHKVQFLHGYPSAIFEFAKYCESDNGELLKLLKQKLKGAFLSSEFPHSHYRNPIEDIFGIKTQSFYGHTERCVMAYEKDEKFIFHIAQTYGYAEIVDNYLIGTSYNSFGTPLIRYNTNDLVESVATEGDILSAFKVTQGRDGDYILDHAHKKISLTGLIFGRHHKLFDYVEHIQVYQDEPGLCTILYTTNSSLDITRAKEMFDATNVKIDFNFIQLNEPIKSISGKVLLKTKGRS